MISEISKKFQSLNVDVTNRFVSSTNSATMMVAFDSLVVLFQYYEFWVKFMS